MAGNGIFALGMGFKRTKKGKKWTNWGIKIDYKAEQRVLDQKYLCFFFCKESGRTGGHSSIYKEKTAKESWDIYLQVIVWIVKLITEYTD